MAGVPARTVLAVLLAGTFAGIPASASDKEVQVELIGEIEPTCKLARDGVSGMAPSHSEKIELCNERASGVAVRARAHTVLGI